MDYVVEIKEFLSRQIKVTANSEEEAIIQVKKQYLDSNIVLDANDFVDFEINILQNWYFLKNELWIIAERSTFALSNEIIRKRERDKTININT